MIMKSSFLDNKKCLYAFALLAILVESFSSVFLKYAGMYKTFSLKYIFFYGCAIGVMGIYAIMWQYILEHLPLSTAYLRKGISYIVVYVWAFVFFGEKISIMQWVGTAIILVGMVVSQKDEMITQKEEHTQ